MTTPVPGIPGRDQSLDAAIQSELNKATVQTNQPQGNLFSNDPYNSFNVYLGTGVQRGPGFESAPFAPGVSPNPGSLQGSTGMGWSAYSDAVLAPTSWGDSQMRDFVNKGIVNKVPGFEVGMGMPQIQAAWQNLVQSSILFNQKLKPGQKPWSPMDVMNTWATDKKGYGTVKDGDWMIDVATGERIKYVGKRSKTVTNKQIDLTSAADVKALASQMLSELLGRAPTAKELAQFRSSINSEEKATPTVTQTTLTATDQSIADAMSSGGDVFTGANQSSVTSGGVSDAARAALISAPTQETKEYGKFQSGTTYWDAMMQMIGGS
jgi:hypothetical protein